MDLTRSSYITDAFLYETRYSKMDEVKVVENNLCLFQFFQNYLLFNVHVFKSLLFSSILKFHSHKFYWAHSWIRISVAMDNQKCFGNISYILATYFISFLENNVPIKLVDLIYYKFINYIYFNLGRPRGIKGRGGFLE